MPVLRYWDSMENQVKVRYWDSKFLGHTAHMDLLKHFNQSIQNIDQSKIIQISFDGPSVNWLFYEKLAEYRQEELQIEQKMINIGSCGLHIVHGAFKDGIKATDWKAQETLKGSYQVLHDTPARRADYTSATQSSDFAFFFCGTRWVEDKKVADRLLTIWPNMVKIVKFWESLLKSKHPSSKSYENVKAAVQNQLTPAKLSVFSFLALLFEPFLRKYQSNEPIHPYLHGDLVKLFKSVLKLVIKDDVIDKCATSCMLTKIDFKKKANFKDNQESHLGFATESILSELMRKDVLKADDIKKFYDEVRKWVVLTMTKMSEKSPLIRGCSQCRNFDPKVIMANKETRLQKKTKALAAALCLMQILPNHSADKAVQQFNSLKEDVETAVVDQNLELSKFGRLDTFFFQQLKVAKYPELSSVIKILLTLSHGQADVERGFSLNQCAGGQY